MCLLTPFGETQKLAVLNHRCKSVVIWQLERLASKACRLDNAYPASAEAKVQLVVEISLDGALLLATLCPLASRNGKEPGGIPSCESRFTGGRFVVTTFQCSE